MNNKIGVGVVTCNRESFFKQCIASLPEVDTLVVVNDGEAYFPDAYPSNVKEVIQHTKNKSVGVSKNELLRFLVQDKCDHIFLVEDDIFMKKPDVFEQYIKTAQDSGIWHLNFGCHGYHNKAPHTGQFLVKKAVQYENETVDFYQNILGACSYYLRSVIKNVGYMDEKYHNAMEHVDHTYKIIQAGAHPPFWWFADIHNSWEYIGDIEEDHKGSEIRKDQQEFMQRLGNACAWFQHKHGFQPMQVPATSETDFVESLKTMHTNYANKVYPNE